MLLPPGALEPTASLLRIIGFLDRQLEEGGGPDHGDALVPEVGRGAAADNGNQQGECAPLSADLAGRKGGRVRRASAAGLVAGAEASLGNAVELTAGGASGAASPEPTGACSGTEETQEEEEGGAAADYNDAADEPPGSQEEAAGDGGLEAAQSPSQPDDPGSESARGRAALRELTARLEGREQLEGELSGMVEGLGALTGSDGAPLLDAPCGALLAATRRLLAERRGEYGALDGWSGPHG